MQYAVMLKGLWRQWISLATTPTVPSDLPKELPTPTWTPPLSSPPRYIIPHKQKETLGVAKNRTVYAGEGWNSNWIEMLGNLFLKKHTCWFNSNECFSSVAASWLLIVWPDHAWGDIIPAASHWIAADSWTFLTLTLLPPRCQCICQASALPYEGNTPNTKR